MGAPETLVLVGPTGVGKTAVALAMAALEPIEVLSADSRQVYRGLDIATAKPTRRERERLPHHLLDMVPPGERYSAGHFARDAVAVLEEIRLRGRTPVVVGGTGLYVRALADGLFMEPPMDMAARLAMAAWTRDLDFDTLARWARRLDRGYGGGGGPQRAARAIEVALLTGRPLSWWQRAARSGATIRPWSVRLTVPRQVLHQRIQSRAAEMVRRGLVEEVAAALADGAPLTGPGMDGIGVREAVDVLQGRLDRSMLVDAITIATRQYARRQETWFRHQLTGPVLALDATRPPEQLAAAILTAFRQDTE